MEHNHVFDHGHGFYEDGGYYSYDISDDDDDRDLEVGTSNIQPVDGIDIIVKDELMDQEFETAQTGGNVDQNDEPHAEDTALEPVDHHPTSSSNPKEIDISDLYTYDFDHQKTWDNIVKRTTYKMNFDREKMQHLGVENHNFYAVAILDLAARLSTDLPPNVKLGIEINAENFEKPFGFPLRPIANYNTDFIERELDIRMQSAKEIQDPGANLDVTLTLAVPLNGSGKPRPPTLNTMKKLSGQRNLFGHGGGTVSSSRNLRGTREPYVFENDVSTHCLATAVCQGVARIKWQLVPDSHQDKVATYNTWINWKRIKQCGGRKRIGQGLWMEAEQLLRDSGITHTRDFTMDDVAAIQRHLKGQYQLLIFNADFHGSDPVFKGEYVDRDHILPLQLKENHYQLISSINTFMGVTNYCTYCYVGNGSKQLHYKCPLKCTRCLRDNCPRDEGVQIRCQTCRISFKSADCFQAHQRPGDKGGKSRCANTAYCKKCDESYYTDHGYEHVCGKKFCTQCCQMKGPGHKHVLSALNPKKEYTQKRVFFDIETRVVDCGGGLKEHQAVVIIALSCCPTCSHEIGGCLNEARTLLCGNCSKDRSGVPGHRLAEFSRVDPGEEHTDVLQKFGKWLFRKEKRGFTAVAHNLKGFDGQLLLQYLLTPDMPKPDKLILAGRKLNFLEVGGIRVLDSYNFVPFGLATFSKSFDVQQLKKGDFPFKFIQPENYGYIGPLPSKEMYDYDNKTSAAKKRFDEEFYNARAASHVPFNFREEIKEYCYSDVALLAASMIKFETNFFRMTNVMLFEECVTSASAAMVVFRRNFVTQDAMVLDSDPSSRRLKQSSVARRFLAYLQSEESETIMSANDSGEFQIPGTQYYVDGYIRKCDKYPEGKVIEYKGCYYHMHSCSYDDTQMTANGQRAVDVRRRDAEREARIKQFCPEMEIYWGCEVTAWAKAEPKLAAYLEKNLTYGPAVGLEAMFGGRTEPIRLRKELTPDTTIRYMDFTSLYPYVMKMCEFPIGEPVQLLGREIQCPITTPEQLKAVCQGYMSCKVLPPPKLFLPVLPLRGEKLLFCLCSACAELQTKQLPVPNPCPHTAEERCLNGTWTTIELALALEKGYVIQAVHGAVHWSCWKKYQKNGDQIDHGLFSRYINTFLKEKQEASGYPSSVVTDDDKDAYIESYYAEEGIKLEKDKIRKDPVMRQISKLLLNSLWGKFGERIDKKKTEIVTNPQQFYRIMNNPAVEMMSIQIHNNYAISVQTQAVEGALNALPTSALPYAIMTLAHARVRLYSALDLIPNPEQNVLYMDTDSVVYAADSSAPNPLQELCGDYLGLLTDEVEPGMHITDFVTVGAKSYAYKTTGITDPTKFDIHLKAKGFPRTGDMEQEVTMDLMKSQVAAVIERQKKLAEDPDADVPEVPIATVNYHQIRTDADHRLIDKYMRKEFRFTFDKRHILPDGGTLPYGFQ